MPVPVVLWMHWSHCAKASSIANHTDGTRQYRTIHHLQIKMVRSFQGPDQTQPDKWSRITWFQSFPKSEVTAVPSAGHKSSKRTGPTCNRRKWCDWLFECSMVWSCPSSFKRAPLTPLVRDLLVESRTWSRIARDFQNSGKGAGNVCSCVLQGSDIEHTQSEYKVLSWYPSVLQRCFLAIPLLYPFIEIHQWNSGIPYSDR